METITITHRVINGKNLYNKRFDDYDNGYYGSRITKKEYEKSLVTAFANNQKRMDTQPNDPLGIVERITYEN